MQFISTRQNAPAASIDDALVAGLAPDGGLYVPGHFPKVAFDRPLPTLADTAHVVLSPYFVNSSLRDRLAEICAHAFDVPAPLSSMRGAGDFVLELLHGSTAAFKDYAARFLAVSLSALRTPESRPLTILVATSGDTGAAVAAAFHLRAGFDVVILYPDGKVSPRQAHGLGCWGDNVRAFRVAGSFDDCQRMAKQALADDALRARRPLSSANSISLGRLLPQAAYYAHASVAHRATSGEPLNVIIPTGSLGNACAAVLARRMGAPIGEIRLATNANDVLPRFLEGANYAPAAMRATLANAMDVAAPSNIERLRHWHRDDAHLRASIAATAVDDATIREVIRRAPTRHGIVPCPHTATALHVLKTLRAEGDAALGVSGDGAPGEVRRHRRAAGRPRGAAAGSARGGSRAARIVRTAQPGLRRTASGAARFDRCIGRVEPPAGPRLDSMAMHLLSRPRSFEGWSPKTCSATSSPTRRRCSQARWGCCCRQRSAAFGDGKVGLYEPLDGSAPDIAGRDIANPLGAMLSAALLLRHSPSMEAGRQRASSPPWLPHFDNDALTAAGRTIGTRAVTDAVVAWVRSGCYVEERRG